MKWGIDRGMNCGKLREMKSILVVEDDRLLGREIVEELTQNGFAPVLARDGAEALASLTTGNFGLIFLDIMLPGDLDGFEILKRLKADEKLENIPVIILSNLGQTQEIDRAMDLGARDYVVKATVDLDRLAEIAKKHLSPA